MMANLYATGRGINLPCFYSVYNYGCAFIYENGDEYIMLTGKQRGYLRSLANELQPIFQIGKGGINDNMVKQFNDALEARELVKANVLKNSAVESREVCEQLARLTKAEIVQVIGNKFVLYKQSKKNKVIELP